MRTHVPSISDLVTRKRKYEQDGYDFNCLCVVIQRGRCIDGELGAQCDVIRAGETIGGCEVIRG